MNLTPSISSLLRSCPTIQPPAGAGTPFAITDDVHKSETEGKRTLEIKIQAAEAALGGHDNVEEGNAKGRGRDAIGFWVVADSGSSSRAGSGQKLPQRQL
jgi:hypothetical protein